jgi:serine protease Do
MASLAFPALRSFPVALKRWLLAGACFTMVSVGDFSPLSSPTSASWLPGFQVSGAQGAEFPGSFSSLVEKVVPAVVNISVTQAKREAKADDRLPDGFPVFPPGSPFDEFFKQFRNRGDGEDNPRRPRGRALGSGFVIDPNGFIVTNSHVVEDASEITVTLRDGTDYKAKLIGRDERTDLAVIKINANKPLSFVEFGDSENAKVGDWVVAIGNPFGIGTTVTAGIISARGRDIGSGPYDDFLQIDAPINHGNSGGPTFTLDGKVIGINTAIYSPTGGSVGIGFAIPTTLARPVIDQLKGKGRVERGWLGLTIQPVSAEIAESLGLDKASGALISEVSPEGPSAKAGLQSRDVVLSVGGKDVATSRDLSRMIADLPVGSTQNLRIWRDGKAINLKVTLGALPDQLVASANPRGTDNESPNNPNSAVDPKDVLGLKLSRLDEATRQRLDLGNDVEGVVVTDVDEEITGERLQPGDIILTVGKNSVKSARDVANGLAEAGRSGQKSILLRINRRGNEVFVAIPAKAG